LVIAFIWIAMGVFFIAIGVSDAYREYRLLHVGMTTMATVTEKRYFSRDPLPGIYSVRYRYEVGNNFYTLGDFLGRTNLWATIPNARWSETPVLGQLPVRYLPDRPSVSVPTDTKSGAYDSAAAAVIGLILIAFSIRVLRAVISEK
jgi:hypothetical protein